jgi:hypothetical protein
MALSRALKVFAVLLLLATALGEADPFAPAGKSCVRRAVFRARCAHDCVLFAAPSVHPAAGDGADAAVTPSSTVAPVSVPGPPAHEKEIVELEASDLLEVKLSGVEEELHGVKAELHGVKAELHGVDAKLVHDPGNSRLQEEKARLLGEKARLQEKENLLLHEKSRLAGQGVCRPPFPD